MKDNGLIIATLDGWKVKQYFNEKVNRWYVTFSRNSPLSFKIGRYRLLRSHFNWMHHNDQWEIPLGYVIHHVDYDRLNDTPDNLLLMTSFDHDHLHRDDAALHGATGFRGRKHSDETRTRMSEIAKKRGNNAIWDSPKTHHNKRTKDLMSAKASGSNNAMFRAELDPVAILNFYRKCLSLKHTAKHFGCSVSAVRYRLDPALFASKGNPFPGRERKYQFDDAEMVAFYETHGAVKAAEKYGCTVATIYYRKRAFGNENSVNQAAE